MMRFPIVFSTLLLSGLLAAAPWAGAEVVVGEFSATSPDRGYPRGWRVAKVPNVAATRFRLVEDDGIGVMQLDAENAAGSLYRPIRVDPAATPLLRWRWRVANLIPGADLTSKAGDDVPARLYVMFDYPLERLSLADRAKILIARSVAGELVPAAALCYVWEGKLGEGKTLWNAYSDRVRVIVVESGSRRIGEWVSEERDVAADFRSAFGEEAPPVSGIAIAADTDQTGQKVRSWFGDIRFNGRAP
jgi:hypothetical protein